MAWSQPKQESTAFRIVVWCESSNYNSNCIAWIHADKLYCRLNLRVNDSDTHSQCITTTQTSDTKCCKEGIVLKPISMWIIHLKNPSPTVMGNLSHIYNTWTSTMLERASKIRNDALYKYIYITVTMRIPITRRSIQKRNWTLLRILMKIDFSEKWHI